eukprot:gene11795-biopygen5340
MATSQLRMGIAPERVILRVGSAKGSERWKPVNAPCPALINRPPHQVVETTQHAAQYGALYGPTPHARRVSRTHITHSGLVVILVEFNPGIGARESGARSAPGFSNLLGSK